MDEMQSNLEELLLCSSLSIDQHDLIERCLDEGYDSLSAEDKSTIRRLLNRRAASLGSSALQRWRARRDAQRAAGKPPGRRAGKSASNPPRN